MKKTVAVLGVMLGALTLTVMPVRSLYAGQATSQKRKKKEPAKPTYKAPVYENWKCGFCQFPFGLRGSASGGLTNVSQGSYKYGQYSGLVKSGIYPDASFNLHYLDKHGDYMNAAGRHLGLQSRKVNISGGRQGSYELQALYEEIPDYLYQSAVTPFVNTGSSSLRLPSNWVPGGSTANMPRLESSLRSFDLQSKRTIEKVGLKLPAHKSHWSYAVGFRHDTQKGTQAVGGSFITTSTLLPETVDYSTDQVNASANYAVQLWQLKLGYYGSFFHDSNAAQKWQNPFTPFAPGADVGQLGQPPSNNFNQLSATGAWQLPGYTRVMTMLAYGRGIQDAQFLPVTVNPDLQPAPLPRSSLDGEVLTRNYVVRINSAPLSRLELTADYTFDQHQDQSPQALYPQVLTDAYVANALMNYAYSFERRNTRIGADYRMNEAVRLGLGGEHSDEEQTFQNVTNTRTNSVWISSHIRPARKLTLYLKVLSSNRVAPNYEPLAELLLPENPLLRQYNIGSRVRTQGLASLSYTPTSYLDVSFQWQQNLDQYNDTHIGLTSSRNTNYTLNLGLQPVENVSVSGYYTEEHILNNQAGSQNLSTADWYGDREDSVYTSGIDAEWRNVVPKWSIGGSLMYQLARGEIAIVQSGTAGAFPNIIEKTQEIQVYARRELSDRLALSIQYGLQRYRSNDWALDGVTPSTVPNVLTLGMMSPNYTIDVVAVAVQYTF